VLPVVLAEAVRAADFAAAQVLLREYVAGLGVDLYFQEFEAELDLLPEIYGAPRGCLFLARAGGRHVGCGALRSLAAGESCEMKRLYVRREARGSGLGRILAESLIAKGRSLGYAVMRLDTLAHLSAARGLYRSLGFVEIAAYYENPLPNVVYMELDLSAE
jgi:putative acetyltransferase